MRTRMNSKRRVGRVDEETEDEDEDEDVVLESEKSKSSVRAIRS
jgi:hypothetical protein